MHNVGQNALFHVLDAFYWVERPVHFWRGTTHYAGQIEPHGADRLATFVSLGRFDVVLRMSDNGGLNNFEGGGGRQFISPVFIANAHNEPYAFYTEKGGFLKKNQSQ